MGIILAVVIFENIDNQINKSINYIQIKSQYVPTNKTASDLGKTFNEQIDKLKINPDKFTVKSINQIPQKIQQVNPISKKPQINSVELKSQIHRLVNQLRENNGVKALQWDEKLANIAKTHSKDMADNNYFSHTSPDGTGPEKRATLFGYVCQNKLENKPGSIGENIFQNNLYNSVWYVGEVVVSYDWKTQEQIAHSTIDGWMSSQIQRDNILENSYKKHGIGVAIADNGKIYITQNLC